MARSAIQFQKGLSLPDFQRLYGTEEQCEAALEKARWPDGFRCPRCGGHEHGLVYGRRLKRYQCRSCGHQATLTAGTIMQATKLPLTTWFLAFYLIGQAKTGISSLELSRHLGVNYDTAWLLHNKILRAMTEREEAYVLRGKIQMDDAYLGGERPGGKAGRGSENKIPIVAALSLNEAGHPIHARISVVSGFSSEAIADWAKRHLMPGSQVLSDGLACFRAVTTANCHHQAVVTGGKLHPNDLPQSLDQHPSGQRQDQLPRHLPCLQFRQVRQALPGRLLLPLQQALLDGNDDRSHYKRRQLLHALHGEGSQGRGGLWVIKTNLT